MYFILATFFISFELMKDLKGRNSAATGTVRFNRMNNCPIKTDNDMKKEHLDVFNIRFDVKNGILGVVWKDNNCQNVIKSPSS